MIQILNKRKNNINIVVYFFSASGMPDTNKSNNVIKTGDATESHSNPER